MMGFASQATAAEARTFPEDRGILKSDWPGGCGENSKKRMLFGAYTSQDV